MKYNIALIPQYKKDNFISLAANMSDISNDYILGKNSYPHVTLYQFEYNETDIENLWPKISLLLKNSIRLQFDEFSCITFNNVDFWVSLLPNDIVIIHNLHEKVANILNLPVKPSFDPHLTLINSLNPDCKYHTDTIRNEYTVISDEFVIAIGESDGVGQFTKILYSKLVV